MKIRMKADVSGSRNGQPWPRRGGVLDVPDDEGAELCASGIAIPVAEAAPDVETRASSDDEETQPGSGHGVEKRALTTEAAPAVAKKAAAPRKTPAKQTSAGQPAGSSK